MTTKLHIKARWDDDLPEILTVYGLKGVKSLLTRDCVESTVDEGDSLLITVKLYDKTVKLRILKSFPDLGIVVPLDKSEQTFNTDTKDIKYEHPFILKDNVDKQKQMFDDYPNHSSGNSDLIYSPVITCINKDNSVSYI